MPGRLRPGRRFAQALHGASTVHSPGGVFGTDTVTLNRVAGVKGGVAIPNGFFGCAERCARAQRAAG
jgi:hypothetical protein